MTKSERKSKFVSRIIALFGFRSSFGIRLSVLGLLCLGSSLLAQQAASTSSVSSGPIASDYKLTGISVLAASKWASLSVRTPTGSHVNYSLKEGTREGSIELLEVDSPARRVRIRDAGRELILSLDKDGVTQADVKERKFVDDHTRAHELRELKERERAEKERKENLKKQPD